MKPFAVAIKDFRRTFRAKRIAKAIVATVEPRLEKLDKQIADATFQAGTRVRNIIWQHSATLKPNSPEYRAWKKRSRLSPHPLIAAGEYADSIRMYQISPMLYEITVEDATHSSGINMHTLSRMLERGTLDGIPARPHMTIGQREGNRRLALILEQFRHEQKKMRRRR